MTVERYRSNLEAVQQEIRAVCDRVGRDASAVRIIAVTKTVEPTEISALLAAGMTDFGENRWQQARPKLELPEASRATWHFIGTLQLNKVKYVARHFDMVHSIDSTELGIALAAAAAREQRALDGLIQVNVSGEAQKHGVAPEEVREVVRALSNLSGLRLRGLMTMAPKVEKPEEARPVFHELYKLLETVQHELALPEFCELSMGMSDDYAVAVEEGATMVRIGRKLMA